MSSGSDDKIMTYRHIADISRPDGSKTKVMVIDSRPKKYKSFDELKNTVFTDIDENRLTVLKNGKPVDYYLNETFDKLYLTKNKANGTTIIGHPDNENLPFEDFMGKKVDLVQKDFFDLEHTVLDLPYRVKFGVSGAPNCYEMVGDDGYIYVDKVPSIRYRIAKLHDLMQKNEWDTNDINDLREIQRFFHPLPIFDQEELSKYPELKVQLDPRN
jgi:hypothetical protein